MGINIGTVPDRCQAFQMQERTAVFVRVYVVMNMRGKIAAVLMVLKD
jgi:hypothetical protein